MAISPTCNLILVYYFTMQGPAHMMQINDSSHTSNGITPAEMEAAQAEAAVSIILYSIHKLTSLVCFIVILRRCDFHSLVRERED